MDEGGLLILEVISVILNLGFIFLLSKEMVWCWPFGILGSLSGSILFYYTGYRSESVLYLFYALIGIYGWYLWYRPKSDFVIKRLKIYLHLIIVLVGCMITWLLGSYMSGQGAERPYYDAFSTAFGIAATFLEMYKFLGGWIYWIVLNIYSIWLYTAEDLWWYAVQMVIFTFMSVYGFIQWQKLYQKA